MNANLELEIVTAAETAVKELVTEITIPAWNGQAGILPNHLPYIVILRAGELSYRLFGGEKRLFCFISGGFLEVNGNKVTVVADALERAEELRRPALEAEMKEAEARLQSAFGGAIGPEEVEAENTRLNNIRTKLEILKKAGLA